MKCSVHSTTTYTLPKQKIIAILERTFRLEKKKHVDVSVVGIGDRRMRTLNHKFRDKDKTTDVLSFTLQHDPLEGEIYISIPQAKRQAREFRHSVKDEILQLVIHGALHLCGYDHMTGKDAETMRKKEERVWNLITK